jgi:hypothetical protein
VRGHSSSGRQAPKIAVSAVAALLPAPTPPTRTCRSRAGSSFRHPQGPLIQLALSRSREELADVSGVNLTRNPVGLMRALQKLETSDKPFAGFNHATAAMCIDDPLQHHEAWFHHLFDTHPPLEERIAILEKISLGQPK